LRLHACFSTGVLSAHLIELSLEAVDLLSKIFADERELLYWAIFGGRSDFRS
jgi:hypothetical protein